MKLFFASDIHGVASCAKRMAQLYAKENADRLILLGDLLYHGPRNGVPEGYDPAATIDILNDLRSEILCIRGNCDSQVDQMVLSFPITAENLLLYLDGHGVFVTHGHIFSPAAMPSLKKGDVLLYGHTHIIKSECLDGVYALNPGSLSLPKENNPRSYMLYEDGAFSVRRLDDEAELLRLVLGEK